MNLNVTQLLKCKKLLLLFSFTWNMYWKISTQIILWHDQIGRIWIHRCMKPTVNLTILCVIFFPRIPLCTLINQHLSQLARKFPQTKFLKSISTTCIPDYPDRNLPTIFVYFEGEMKGQFIGPLVFGGMNLKVEGRRLLPVKERAVKHTFSVFWTFKMLPLLLLLFKIIKNIQKGWIISVS